MKKMIILLILINIFLSGFIYAEITLYYNDNADAYKQNILDNNIKYHRSGLLNSQEVLFNEDLPVVEFPKGFDAPLSNDELIMIWNNDFFSEYQPVFNENSQEELAQFIVKDIDPDFNMKYNKILDAITFQRELPAGQTIVESIDEYINKSKIFINEQLSVFKDRIEFENTIVEYIQCLSRPDGNSSPKEIESVIVRYRRLFQGRILSNNVSYLQVELNKSGEVISVSVKWPELKIINTDQTQSSEKIISYLENLIINIKCLNPQKDINKATIEGIALTWRQITKEDQTVITPVYSYLVKLEYTDGSTNRDFFDAPVLQYGWNYN